MKHIIAFILIIIATLVTSVSATMINQWFGVFICGVWLLILGFMIELSELFNRK